MIVVLSDTHSNDGHRLAGRALDAVREAAVVLHAGDFVTAGALAAFREESERLWAVHGNADDPGVCDRLPATRTVEAGGARFVLAHGDRRGETGLAMLGRERAADVVVSGHSHVPGVVDAGPMTLLDPGSHADPRGNPASHAELEPAAGGLRGRIRERDGSTLREFVVETEAMTG